MTHKQLYERIDDVIFDELSTPLLLSKSFSRPETSKATMFTFKWPNGSPCLLIELYLQTLSFEILVNDPKTTSLNTIAGQLSHIVRFAWAIRKDFWELEQKDIEDFVFLLMHERPSSSKRPQRNENTIDAIVSATLRFISWLQDDLFLNISLLGLSGDRANIRLKSKRVTDWLGNQRVVSKFPHLPPRATRQPKSPISRDIRGRLWRAVSDLSELKNKSKRYLAKFSSEQAAAEELLYIKKRRELLLSLLEATGARPGELSLLSVSQNEFCTKENKVVLRTLKKRKFSERIIPFDPSIAVKLELFIKLTRNRLLSKLGVLANPQDRVFLTKDGNPYSVESMTKEFSRIAIAAGLTDVRACMSMFRHRFITNMVIIHLKAFMTEHHGKLRATLNLADYRTILKRVAVFTGHTSEDSLMNYIDIAWDEMGLFDYVGPTLSAMNKAEGLINELSAIVSSEKLSSRIQNGKVSSEDLLSTLESLLLEHRATYNHYERIMRNRVYPDGND